MTRLTTHISSRFFKAADALQPKASPRKIVVYVEGYDDVSFWRSILNEVERDTPDVIFEVMLPTYNYDGTAKLARGKSSAMHAILNNTGENMFACVDADYDYLMQGATENSQQLLSSPYIFHSYAYAIENLQCYAPGLHEACVMATLNDRHIIDFRAVVSSFSEVAYPLFLWSVWLYRKGAYAKMTISAMDNILRIKYKNLSSVERSIQRMQQRVNHTVRMLEEEFPGNGAELQALAIELESLGVTPQNTYLYIHGHHIMDHVVLPLILLVCKILRRQREEEISRLSRHDVQRQNELSCYNSSVLDIKSVLRKYTAYLSSPQVRQVLEDIRRALSEHKNVQ